MNTDKRIVFLAYSMSGGGLESQIAQLTDAFTKKGLAADLLLWNDDIGYDTAINIINLEKLFGSKTIVSKFKKYWFIKRYLKSKKIDILIDLRHRTKPCLEVFLSNFVLNIKTFSAVHSSDIGAYGFKNKYLVRFIFNKNKQIVCVSKCIAVKIKNAFPFLKNVHYIHNIYEKPNALEELASPINHKYILFSGRIHAEEKQVDQLIWSYKNSEVYNSDVHLVLLGWDEKNLQLQQLVNQLELNNFVHFFPFQSTVQQFYHHALLTVLCSRFEGLPMTLIESLAFETPVVSFDCPCGPSEIIEDDINGRLIKNQDFNELAMVLRELCHSEDRLKFYKENALQSIEKFTTEKVINNWLHLINT